MIKLLTTGVLIGALAWGTAFGQTSDDTSTAAPPAQNSVKLRTVIVDIPAGTAWVSLGFGFCLGHPYEEAWTAGRDQ